MDDEVEAQIRDLHNRGEISNVAFRALLGGDDLDEGVKESIVDPVEGGERGVADPPEGQTCERDGCGKDVVRGIGDEWLCREHQDDLFAAWHG